MHPSERPLPRRTAWRRSRALGGFGVVLAGILTLTTPAVAAAPLGTHQLLRFHSVVSDDDGSIFDDELFFFRDGKVSARHQDGRGVRYQTSQLTAAQLDHLRRVLVDQHVGTLREPSCFLPDFLPNTASFRGSLTWFGKGNRAAHFDFDDPEGPGDPCSEALVRVFQAVYSAFAGTESRSSTAAGTS